MRDEAWLQRAETLLRLARTAEAVEALAKVPADGPLEGRRMLLLGRFDLEAARALPADATERTAKIESALELVLPRQSVQTSTAAGSRGRRCTDRQSAIELRGDAEAARSQFDQLSNRYGDTDEGLAATLAEADYARKSGDLPRAMAGYRTVLAGVGNPQTYDNSLLPLAELRDRLWAAYQQFLHDEQFAESLALLEYLEPVLGRAECMELRAKTHQAWGARRRDQGVAEGHAHGADRWCRKAAFICARLGRALRRPGAHAVRHAVLHARPVGGGRLLLPGAELYERGPRAGGIPAQRSAAVERLALVRLGQARLARGDFDLAIAALEECIEIFPDNPMTHQARLEAARAYRQLG